MEELHGESLEALLSRSGHLSADQAIDIFVQCCEGLESAHQQEVLHRDLKPSNIMLIEGIAPTEDVKLMDFGIARLLAEEGDDQRTSGYITKTREVFGSPMYMSPEQCIGRKLDARSDIYSLGCVMYETLTGKPPFVGKNVLETAYKHMNESPKSIYTDSPGDRIFGRLEAVILKCLAKDIGDRYQSASQVKSDLQLLHHAGESEWSANAFALKKNPRMKIKTSGAKKEKQKSKDAGTPRIPFEMLVFGVATVLLVSVVAVWSFSFLSSDSRNYPAFNNDTLWQEKESKSAVELPNYSAKEQAAQTLVMRMEKEKGIRSVEYAHALTELSMLYFRTAHWQAATQSFTKMIALMNKDAAESDLMTVYSRLAVCYFI